MSLSGCNYNCRCQCTLAALVISAIIGVLTAFFQITGTITVAPVFLWVAFGIGVVYLGVLVVARIPDAEESCRCLCRILYALLIGILGTILLAIVLLAVGIVATSVLSAVLVGLLLFFFSLTLTSSAGLVLCLSGCGS